MHIIEIGTSEWINIMKTFGVIMAGGGGTRFWPLSRKSRPKQFLNLSGKDTMVMEAALRLATVAKKEDIFVVTSNAHRDMTIELTKSLLSKDHILGEPAARNTAACIGYGAMEIIKKYEDGIMVIVPSDPFIKDGREFTRVLNNGVQTAIETDSLVTIGIKPTFPCTGYGYIKTKAQCEAIKSDVRQVLEFVEKPDLETAKKYLNSGEYSWNSGMFIWKASTILKYFERLLPDIYEYLVKIGDAMGTDKEKEVIDSLYPQIPKISIDYGIMERADNVLMLEGDFGWNDVGSFDALKDVYGTNEQGNVIMANAHAIDTEDCILYGSDTEKLIATLGIKDAVVAVTDDVVLVCDKNRAQDIKLFSEQLEKGDNSKFL